MARQPVTLGRSRTLQGAGSGTLSRVARPWLVLISGAPGSGKTTLGRLLADELRVPNVNKDRICDGMIATDPSDLDDIYIRGWELFWDQLQTLLAAGVSLVAEQTLWRGWAEQEVRGRLVPIASVVNVHCRCPTALDRWEVRMGPRLSRDPVGSKRLIEDTRRRIDEFSEPLDLGCETRIEVDTTDGYQPAFPALVAQVRHAVGTTAV